MIKGAKDSLILVVDSVSTNMSLIGNILNNIGFKNLAFANSGYEALEKAKTLKPDLVLLDLSLEDVSGFEVCRVLKANPVTKKISIVVQSPINKLEHRRQAFEAGANDFVNKPIDEIELVTRLTMILEHNTFYLKLLEEHGEMKRELRESAELLTSLLPSEEELVELGKKYSLSLDAYYLPSSILGGDFYSLLQVSEDKLGSYLWDFSGHGVTAAINTFRLSSAIKHCNEYSDKPGEFLTCVNKTLYSINKKGFFATIFYGVIDQQKQVLEYASAACPFPMLLSFKRGEYRFLDTKEFPLGVVNDHVYQTHSVGLREWEALVLYSDALIETKSKVDGEFLTAENLAKAILKSLEGAKDISAADIKREILNEFNPNYSQNIQDDLTFQIIVFSR